MNADLHIIGVKHHEVGERAAGKQKTEQFLSSHRAGNGSDLYVSGWRGLVVCGAMDTVLRRMLPWSEAKGCPAPI